MRAAVYYETGGPEVLRYEEVPDPEVGPGDVLIEVAAIGIQGGDTLNRLGGDITSTPHIVGYQASGTVAQIGEGVTRVAVGDRVVTLGLDGSHAERRVTNELFCWPIADTLSFAQAACVPTEFGTAHDCLFEFGRLESGQSVLVHAGASGVGIAAIQLAKRAGARVLVTASSDERLARLVELGADVTINYANTPFVDAVREATGGAGADVIVDGVGGSVLQESLGCLAYRGRIVSFGSAGRDQRTVLDVSTMSGMNQSLTSYFLGAEVLLSARARDMIAGLLEDVALGRLAVVIDRTFALSEAGDAHAYIESRKAFGRVVLEP